MDYEIEAEILKVDEDRREVTGWFYVAQSDGAQIVDHSGDVVTPELLDDLEKAMHEYMLVSRAADEMHERFDGIGRIVELAVLTPEKCDALGITSKRYGVFGTFHIDDDATLAKVKRGELSMFSIRGQGVRERVAA